MSRIVREAIERYEKRMPGASRARVRDPHFGYQTTWLRHMLDLADMAMEDEGVPEEVRAKVVRGVLYGYPNPADAELRVQQQELLTEALKAQTTMIVMPDGWQP